MGIIRISLTISTIFEPSYCKNYATSLPLHDQQLTTYNHKVSMEGQILCLREFHTAPIEKKRFYLITLKQKC